MSGESVRGNVRIPFCKPVKHRASYYFQLFYLMYCCSLTSNEYCYNFTPFNYTQLLHLQPRILSPNAGGGCDRRQVADVVREVRYQEITNAMSLVGTP